MVDYKELIERYGDAIHEDPENYLDELHSALQDVISERDRLRDALQEAISEIGCLVHPEFMSDSKWKKHKLWIDSLKAALQEVGDENS